MTITTMDELLPQEFIDKDIPTLNTNNTRNGITVQETNFMYEGHNNTVIITTKETNPNMNLSITRVLSPENVIKLKDFLKENIK